MLHLAQCGRILLQLRLSLSRWCCSAWWDLDQQSKATDFLLLKSGSCNHSHAIIIPDGCSRVVIQTIVFSVPGTKEYVVSMVIYII